MAPGNSVRGGRGVNNLEKRILQKWREPTITEELNNRLGFIESVHEN